MSWKKVNVISHATERCLSIGETFHEASHKYSPPIGVEFNVDFLSTTLKVTEECVRSTLLVLCEYNQLLRSKISQNEDGDFFFVPMDLRQDGQFLPLDFVTVDDVTKWHMVTHETIEKGFPDSGPLWKVIWLNPKLEDENISFTLITIFHHAIMDAKGAFDFVGNQFLPKLCDAVLSKEGHKPTEEYFNDLPHKPINFVKSCEEIFYNMHQPLSKQSVKWYVNIAMKGALWFFKKFGENTKERKPRLSATSKYIDEAIIGHYSFSLTATVSKGVLSVCKRWNVSVHSFLLVVIGNCLEKTRKEFPECKGKFTNFIYPIDLRKFHPQLSSPPMPFGTFFDSGMQNIKPVPASNTKQFFDCVKKVHKTVLNQNKVKESSTLMTAFLPILSDNDIDFLDILSFLGVDNVISLSNIGKCSILLESTLPIKVVEHYFGIDNFFGGMMLCTATVNEKMCFCIGYNKHWLPVEFIETFKTFLLEELKIVTGDM